MTYVFPPSLHPLRDYLRGLGADTIAFVSARQAAFMAQQLLGTRVKFPARGSDMTSTLFLIQKAVIEKGKPSAGSLSKAAEQVIKDSRQIRKQPKKKGEKSPPYANSNKNNKDFSPAVFAEGVHIFCDGASVPNPGLGGWGVVVYRDGQECVSSFGGKAETTNNQMELMALLTAIEVAGTYSDADHPAAIWCDSQYCVNGVNDWRHKWKKHGWKKSPNSPEQVKNVELWKAIDEAMDNLSSTQVKVKWVKGHAGIVGNERADELAEMGRQDALESSANLRSFEDLNAQYRAIMAG